MSKKLLELAKENLCSQLLTEFENFCTFIKSENMTISQGYKCFTIKFKGISVGKIRISNNSVELEIEFEYSDTSDIYVEAQSEELVDIFMKSLEHKCINCEEHCCSKKALAMTINVAGNCYKNVCINAFGGTTAFAFSSIGDNMQNMMWITPWLRPHSLRHVNDRPVSVDTVKSVMLIKKLYIMDVT